MLSRRSRGLDGAFLGLGKELAQGLRRQLRPAASIGIAGGPMAESWKLDP